jgi:hypothetical protein
MFRPSRRRQTDLDVSIAYPPSVYAASLSARASVYGARGSIAAAASSAAAPGINLDEEKDDDDVDMKAFDQSKDADAVRSFNIEVAGKDRKYELKVYRLSFKLIHPNTLSLSFSLSLSNRSHLQICLILLFVWT